MSTKLTLRLNSLLIKRAKRYARRHGESVSQIVADYFCVLSQVPEVEDTLQAFPLTQSLRGVIKKTKVLEKEYRDYLVKKYL